MQSNALSLRLVYVLPILVSSAVAQWTQVDTNKPTARYSHKMAYDSARGKTVMFGGINENDHEFDDTWEYDGSDWTQVASTGPSARADHAMAYDSQRNVTVLFGGYQPNDPRDTWEWDGSSWTQVSNTGPVAGLWGSAMTYDSQRGVTMLFGGWDSINNDDLNETWEWDGTQWTLASTTDVEPRSYHSMAYDSARGVTVMFAGYGYFVYATTAEWNGSSWTVLSDSPSKRYQHSMVHDSLRDKTVLFGGRAPNNLLMGDTWEWDGAEWRQVSNTGPAARRWHSMAYDNQRGVSVLFGGQDGSGLIGDTWEWDGTAWTQVGGSSPSAPSPRKNHAIAYDSQRGVSVLFGGQGGSGLIGDTWEWNGTAWAQVGGSSPSAPSPRREYAMAYDSQRGVSVLFGGEDHSGLLGDTWEWDGSSWTQAATAGPAARQTHAMAYNSLRGFTVLFGGQDSNFNRLGDRWSWDGSSWAQLTATSPAARNSHALAYDPQRESMVLFAGKDGSGNYLGDTWESRFTSGFAQPYGAGCGTGPLFLTPATNSTPQIDQSAEANLFHVPSALAFVSLGWSRTTAGSFALPLSLAGFGAPGCELLQSGEDLSLPTTTGPNSTATFQMAIPNIQELVGARIYLQAWAPDAGYNSAGLITSNGLEWVIGNY